MFQFSWQAFGVIFLGSLFYGSALAIRRLFFHPLSHTPGPKLAAVTWYYLAYYDLVLDGALLEHLEVLHQRYGPVVRIGPEKLHFNDPRAYYEIYSATSKVTKDPKFYSSLQDSDTSFGSVDPRQAKLRKDVLRPLFSRHAIIKLEDVVQHSIDRFLNVLTSHGESSPANLFYGYLAATMEIITSYCFSQPFNTIDSPDFQHPLLVTIQTTAGVGLLMQYFPVTKIMLKLPRWLARRMGKQSSALQVLLGTLEAQVDQLLVEPSSLDQAEHENIYHHLLTPHVEKNGMGVPSRLSLVDEAIVLVSAGTDTVANTCTVGTFHILRDQETQKKLMDELLRAWPEKDVPVCFEKLEKLTYLTAIIKESLRLSHGATMPLPRVVPTDTIISGIKVPAGTVVGMGQTFMHYNAEVFHDPRRFHPERWLKEDTREMDSHLVPFSRGPRSCLGMNLAWCELYLLFANIFRKVEMEIFDTSLEDMRIKSYLTPKFRGKPLRVYAKPRIA